MKNLFQKIQLKRPKQNSFDLTHEKKLSANFGNLYPILVQEVLPGDKFSVNSEIFMRLAPMRSPMMHRVDVTTHYFFVPNRIVWDNWEDFITGGEDGLAVPTMPRLSIGDGTKNRMLPKTLSDYMGLPTIPYADGIAEPQVTVTQPIIFQAIPFRGYQTIYNEYYRDQNLTPKIAFSLGDSASETDPLMTIRKRAWEKDYFTSALPFAQRGGEVTIPLGEIVPNYKQFSEVNVSGAPAADGDLTSVAGLTQAGANKVQIDNLDNMTVGAVTINELRKATQLQKWLEKAARGGSRYAEQLLTFWGVRSSDARLQRPEYLGGGKNPVVIREISSTAPTDISPSDPEGPLGHQGGQGTSHGSQNKFTKRFEEHGFIIGIMSIMPRTAYSQGIDRLWLRTDKFDYAWTEFAQLGEQEVLDGEIYWNYTGAVDDAKGTFGYQSRYAEYKYHQSTIHGDMRTNLDYWHLTREFANPPALNTSFVEYTDDYKPFPVVLPSEDHLYVQILNKIKVLRALPYFNTPTL